MKPFYAFLDCLKGHSNSQTIQSRCNDIGCIEETNERCLKEKTLPHEGKGKGETPDIFLAVNKIPISRRFKAVEEAFYRFTGYHVTYNRIIDIEDGVTLLFAALFQVTFEQKGFCTLVTVDVSVIIKMVVGQIGKDTDIKLNPFHSFLVKGMGRDLHCNKPDT